MKDKPILFNTLMVRAILENRKTQTRRVIKNVTDYELECFTPDFQGRYFAVFKKTRKKVEDIADKYGYVKSPYQVGQKLWVKETWHPALPDGVVYKADKEERLAKCMFWKPSIFMPKRYARIWLEVTGIRVERMQDITQDDCIKEGYQWVIQFRRIK